MSRVRFRSSEGVPSPWEIGESDGFTISIKDEGLEMAGSGRGEGQILAKIPWTTPIGARVVVQACLEGAVSLSLNLAWTSPEHQIIRQVSRICPGPSEWLEVSQAMRGDELAQELIITLAAQSTGEGGRVRIREIWVQHTQVEEPIPCFEPLSPGFLCPEPQQVHPGPGVFIFTEETKLIIPPAPSPAEGIPRLFLQAALEYAVGRKFPLATGGQGIYLGTPTENPRIGEILSGEGLMDAFARLPREGYLLQIRPGRILLAGKTPGGTLHGVYTLRSLLSCSEIPSLTIWDWPDHDYRGVLLPLDPDSLAKVPRLIERVIAPLGYNRILLGVENLQWESQPGLGELSKEQIGPILQVARDHMIAVDPYLPTLSGAQWLFRQGQNLEICANPQSPSVYNPSHPRTLQMLKQVIKEVADLFGPRYLHLGHELGELEDCLPDVCQAFLSDIRTLGAILREEGIQGMIWSDILGRPRYQGLAEELSRDLLLVDWNFSVHREYGEMRHLMERGFQTLGGTWIQRENIENYSAFAHRSGALGMLQICTQYTPNQLHALIQAGQAFWRSRGRVCPQPGQLFASLWGE